MRFRGRAAGFGSIVAPGGTGPFLGPLSVLQSNPPPALALTLLPLCRRLVQLNNMRATDALDDDDQRQLMLDLNSSYAAFMQSLG